FTLNNQSEHTQALAQGQLESFKLDYTVTDNDGDSARASLTIQIQGTNDAPILTPGVTLGDQVSEDAQAITPVDVSGQFQDVDNGDTLTFTATGLPPGLTISEAGVITGTLDKSASQGGDVDGAKGVYTITVTATDSHGATVTQEFQWDVSNPAPVAVNDAGATTEDATLTVSDPALGVLANDTDKDGDALTVSHVNGAATNVGSAVAGSDGGTFTLNTNGTYSFNPGSAFQSLAQGATATSSITYTVTDADGATSNATLTVTVTGTNDAPILTPGVELGNQVGEDAQLIDPVDVSGQFQDVDNGDTLTFTATGLPPGLTISEAGVITGTLDKSASQGGDVDGAKGVYTIVVTATDTHGATVTQE
ncbi:cadherin-like domain-containing protein, partial [Pollutimonas bauzanensis]